MKLKLHNKINNLKIEAHLLISVASSIINILIITLLFLTANQNNMQNIIAEFSILFVIFFSSSLICLLGNDQEILAKSNNIGNKKKQIVLDEKIFKIIPGILLSALIFYLISKNIDFVKISVTDYQIKTLFYSSILFLINKNIQSYFQASSLLICNSIVDLLRSCGFCLFFLVWFFYDKLDISLIFFYGEAFTFVILPVLFLFNKIKIIVKMNKFFYDFNYLIIGITQFAYQSIFKLDILVLSILGNYKLVILYAILSNVIEGLVNFFATFHPTCNNFILKRFKNIKIESKLEKNIKYIFNVSNLLIILIIPSYIFLNYIIFKEFPDFVFQLMCLLIVIGLLIGKKMFLFFFIFSICKNPLMQLLFSISFIFTNLVLNIILFKYLGVFGVALATSITYIIYYQTHIYLVNKFIFLKN